MILALLTAGCASTAQRAKEARGKVHAGDPEGTVGVEGALPEGTEGEVGTATSSVGTSGPTGKGKTGARGATGTGAAGTGTGTGTGGTGTGGTGGGGGGGGGGSGGYVLGQGVTATEIKIGLQVNAPIDYAAFGGRGSNGDDQKTSQAVVDHINKTGGIAGRKVVPVYHITDTNSGTFAAQAEAACADFVDDKKVFAAISTTNAGEPAQCYANRGMPYISHKRGFYPAEYFQRMAGSLYTPGRMGITRWTVAYVDALVEQGYFAGGAKVALLRYDHPDFDKLTDQVLKPRLAARGVTLADEFRAATPGSVAGLSDTAASASAAVVRFRANGITHVMFYEIGGVLPFFFMPQAESQANWRPRYAMTTAMLPQFQKANVPEPQLHRTVGIGWVPADDLAAPEDPGGNPNTELCKQIWANAGITPTTRINLGSALGYCDSLLFLKAALDRTTNLTVAGLKAAVEGLGDSFNSPLTFATRFGPGRYDGPTLYRNLEYFADCKCFKYTSGPKPAP
ncbi:MAG TPA: hypothetical protein VHF47_00465 [Acidimicrobiales bacterium]|nr:hypothetical protein [Acidimicrobiales bacterium]